MARINIEDTLWSDPRFLKLCVKIGDERAAIGAVVLAWKLAQKYWCPKKELIPLSDWAHTGIGREIIEVGLVRETSLGLEVAGCEEHFAWYFEMRDGAKKGGAARMKNVQRDSKGRLVKGRQKPSPIQRSSSSSSSSSFSYSNSKDLSEGRADAREGVATRDFIAAYCEAYKAKYGVNPPINGKAAGIAARTVKDFGLEKSCDLVRAYLQMSDPRWDKECHPLGLFTLSITRVGTALAKGVEDPGAPDYVKILREHDAAKGVAGDTRKLPSAS